MSEFNYFYGLDAEQFNFFRIPKKLILDPKFRGLSNDAKILYSIMLDRMTLSARNGWVDDENRVYIIFTVKDVTEELGCSERKAIMLMGELDTKKGIGLIEKKRQGLGRPNLLYVKNFNDGLQEVSADQEAEMEEAFFQNQESEVTGEVHPVQTCKNVQVKTCKNMQVKTCKDVQNQTCKNEQVKTCKNVQDKNDTDKSKTNNIYNLSINPEKEDLREDRWMDRDLVLHTFRKKLHYRELCADFPEKQKQLDEIFCLLTDCCCSKKREQRIGDQKIQTAKLRIRFLQELSEAHVRYVLQMLEQQKSEIRNIRAYLLTCLYNAPATMNWYYTSQVWHI